MQEIYAVVATKAINETLAERKVWMDFKTSVPLHERY